MAADIPKSLGRIRPYSSAAQVVRVTTAVTAVHGLEVLLWACAPKALRTRGLGLGERRFENVLTGFVRRAALMINDSIVRKRSVDEQRLTERFCEGSTDVWFAEAFEMFKPQLLSLFRAGGFDPTPSRSAG